MAKPVAPAKPRQSKPRKQRPAARDRDKPFKVYVNPEQRAQILANAEQANVSVSSYLAAVGCNTPLRSVVDLQAVDHLLHINADLGRLGGLLKMWLASRPGEGATSAQVQQLLHALQAGQAALMTAISAVRRSR